jgi:hypothetical protein
MSRPHVTPRLGAVLALLAAGFLAGPSARAEPTDELAEIRALRERGGHEASERLGALIRDGSEEVRVTALKAVAAVGVRSRKTTGAAREALHGQASLAQWTAALEALGRVGGGQDVPVLLDGLKAADEQERRAALRALQALSGRKTPQDYRRWYQWWSKHGRWTRAAVQRAIRDLPDAEGKERMRLRTLLARDGWTETDFVEDAASEWLRAGDRTLRTHGFYLAAVLRLADLVPDVESALPHLTTVDGEDGLLAVRALGLSAELLAPYWRKRFESGR